MLYWFSRFNLRPSLVAALVFSGLCALVIKIPPIPLRHYYVDAISIACALAYYVNNLFLLTSIRPQIVRVRSGIEDAPIPGSEQRGSIGLEHLIEAATIVPWVTVAGVMIWLLY